MKSDKTIHFSENPARLPLFPAPYPGESYYSILCRYHLRSGNATDRQTILQLFGYYARLFSTILSPYHLAASREWFPAHASISAEDILRHHTAYHLYALTASGFEIEQICRQINHKGSRRRQSNIVQRKLIHPSKHLRYCPECAAEQKAVYGESYWQVLPQLDGVEYCPIHKTRIQNSNITARDIMHRFFPATEVLNKTQHVPFQTDGSSLIWESLYHAESDFFIKMAQGMAWLFENAIRYPEYHTALSAYQYFLKDRGLPHRNYTALTLYKIENIFVEYSYGNYLSDYLVGGTSYSVFYNIVYLYSLPLYAHVMLMIALAGSPKEFYAASS